MAFNYKFSEDFDYEFTQLTNTTNSPPLPPNNGFEAVDENDFLGIPLAAQTSYLQTPTGLVATGNGSRTYWTGQIGVGMSYFPFPKVGISSSLRYHRSLKGIGDQPKHLQQFGAWIGITYRIGN